MSHQSYNNDSLRELEEIVRRIDEAGNPNCILSDPTGCVNEEDLNASPDLDKDYDCRDPYMKCDGNVNYDDKQFVKTSSNAPLQNDSTTKPETNFDSSCSSSDHLTQDSGSNQPLDQTTNIIDIEEPPKSTEPILSPTIHVKNKNLPFNILRKTIKKRGIKKYVPFKAPKTLTGKALKNVAKNYGKFCTNWALKPLGLDLLKKKKPNLSDKELNGYTQYIEKKKDIGSIKAFRDLLLPGPKEEPSTKLYKECFQYVSETLAREYSHNWVFSSTRIEDAWVLVCTREKILRRIQNPKRFTYLT